MNNKTIIKTLDSTHISIFEDESIDVVITDPPWGIFENIEDIMSFYSRVLKEILRVVKSGGCIVILTAQKDIIETCFKQNKVFDYKRIDTLVNGKKSAVYIATKP